MIYVSRPTVRSSSECNFSLFVKQLKQNNKKKRIGAWNSYCAKKKSWSRPKFDIYSKIIEILLFLLSVNQSYWFLPFSNHIITNQFVTPCWSKTINSNYRTENIMLLFCFSSSYSRLKIFFYLNLCKNKMKTFRKRKLNDTESKRKIYESNWYGFYHN